MPGCVLSGMLANSIMKKLHFLIFSFIFFMSCSTGPSAPEKPNILLILVDDLGYGDLSCQGALDLQSPNIDNLMTNGVILADFYANCPVCSPSRASLLTGRYPDLVGVPGVIREEEVGNWGYFQPAGPTLPEILRKAGYKTAIIGKWHLGLESPNTPNERGFDFFHGFLGDMMDDYYTHLRHGHNYMRMNSNEIDPEGHATEIFTDWAVDYIEEQKRSEQPFFLYLAYNAPHDPIQPPENWLDKVKARENGISDQRAGIVALIEHLDEGIGKVINTLITTDQYKNTIIIFSSDNGGALRFGASNGSLRGGKQDMFEGGIKVPTCIVWNGELEPSIIPDQTGMTMDFYPTLCDIAGIPVDHKIDGISLWPVIKGKQKEVQPDRMLFWVRREGWFYNGMAYYAARQRNLKLVQNTPFEEFLYFNIQEDPREKNPLNEESDTAKRLRLGLQEHIRESGKVPFQRTRNPSEYE